MTRLRDTEYKGRMGEGGGASHTVHAVPLNECMQVLSLYLILMHIYTTNTYQLNHGAVMQTKHLKLYPMYHPLFTPGSLYS
jgi:hypothetical protein